MNAAIWNQVAKFHGGSAVRFALAALVPLLWTGIVAGQAFRTAAECDQALKDMEAQASRWDSAFMDCAAGAAHHQVHDCRGMDTRNRTAAFKADAAKRDELSARARSIRPMCEQLHAAARQRERQEAIDRTRQQQAQDQDRKRTQLSIEQANNARIAEARNLGDNNRRHDELKRQQFAQQQAAQKAEAARQAAIRSQQKAAAKAAIMDQSMGALLSLAGLPDPPRTASIDTYTNIQRGVEKLHEGIQQNQPDIVNEVQNNAWAEIGSRHSETLEQVESLKQSLNSFSAEMTKPASPPQPPAPLRGTALPVGPPRGVDAELEQIAGGAYGARARQRDSQAKAVAMAGSNGTLSQQETPSSDCDAYKSPGRTRSPHAATTLSASQRCVADRQAWAEHKRALEDANRCGKPSDITEIKRQLENVDQRIKRDC